MTDLALDDRFFEVTGELREARIAHAELEKAIADRRARRVRLLEAFADGDDQAADLVRGLKAEIDGLGEQLARLQGEIELASGKVGAVEHLRRVKDIREAALSENVEVKQQARAKLRQAISAIINSVTIEKTPRGEKVYTIAFIGGVLGVRIDTKGQIEDIVSHAMGRPLWEFLPADKQSLVEPLVRRIQEQRTVQRVNRLARERREANRPRS